MKWVLMLFFYHPGHYTVAVTTQEFYIESRCESAGQKAKDVFKNTKKQVEYICVLK